MKKADAALTAVRIAKALEANEKIEIGTLRVYPERHGITELADAICNEHLGFMRATSTGKMLLVIAGLNLVCESKIDAVRLARDINDRRARIGTALAHPVVMGNGTLRLTTVPQD